MSLFTTVFLKLFSGLLNVLLGFCAGKFSKLDRDHIASLLFYFISPIVFFAIPANAAVSFAEISVTLVVFCISCLLCLIAYTLFTPYFDESTRNILAVTAGTANSGYLVLPLAATLFDDYTLSIYMMTIVGLNLYESTLGYFICMRSLSSAQESLNQVFRLPNLNAFALGCLYSLLGFDLPDFFGDFVHNMQIVYSTLGMIMIGLGLSTIQKFEIDIKFTICAFISKFLFSPLIINIFILLDKFIFHQYNVSHYHALILLSTAPIAANTMVFASLIKLNLEKVATTVLLSALFSLLYMPCMITLFF